MRLITITGPSGAGKDTVARMLSDMTDWPVICSYTTRPMREGEQEDGEHHFVKECNVPHSEMLAYTQYGGYEYWTTKEQVEGTAIYVIDEKGLYELKNSRPEIEVYSIYIMSDMTGRLARGVKLSRLQRDIERFKTAPYIKYDGRIYNRYGKSFDDLRFDVAKILLRMPFVESTLNILDEDEK